MERPGTGSAGTALSKTEFPILIVDDDAAARELLATHLGREGFEVREAANGEDALSLIGRERVSLVILDMRMPGISGTEVLRRLRERPASATLPIMVLTGQGDDYPLITSLGVGADDYLTKPIRLDELVARIRSRLRSQRVTADLAKAASEELYRALVEHSFDGILVSDGNGRYVEANAAACRMLGYARDELMTISSPNLNADDDTLKPEDLEARMADAVATGLLVERRYRRKDGTSLPAEVGFSQLPDGRLQRVIRDISARQVLEAERTRLISAVEQTGDAIWMSDADGVITYVNPAFTRAYEFRSSEVVGQHGGVLDSGMQGPSFFDAIWDAVHADRIWTGTIINRRKGGSLIEVESVISAIRESDGQFAGYIQADRDVTHERALERGLERDARERDAIQTALAQIDTTCTVEEIAAAACEAVTGLPGVDTTMAVALGESEGSVLAITGPLSAVFVQGMPFPTARVAHLLERGADGPWLEEWRPEADAGPLGEAITATGLLATAYAPLRNPRGVVGVVGIASHDPATASALVEHMPALATFASTLGALIGPKLEDRRRDAEDHSAIQAVLDASAFTPFFQPIVELHSGAVVGYEALSRFADGLPPDLRFASAERAGLGAELELATLRAALATAEAVLPSAAFLSVNVSPGIIVSGALREVFRGVDRPLVVEITEHVAIGDYEALRTALAALGPSVRSAVDDAGAGYASFRHILELNPAIVKLDIGLVRGLDADQGRQALLAGMVYFAIKRRIQLVAEGIETAAELEALRSLAIPYGQGYLLGRPQDGRGPGQWPPVISLATGPEVVLA